MGHFEFAQCERIVRGKKIKKMTVFLSFSENKLFESGTYEERKW